MLQCDDGHWAGDYGGPMFLMPGLIIAYHVTGTDLGKARKAAMQAYLLNHQQVGAAHATPHASCILGPGSSCCDDTSSRRTHGEVAHGGREGSRSPPRQARFKLRPETWSWGLVVECQAFQAFQAFQGSQAPCSPRSSFCRCN